MHSSSLPALPYSLEAKKILEQTQQNMKKTYMLRESAEISDLPPLLKTTRAVVCICVAAFGEQECRSIPRLLAELKKQNWDPEFWEIAVFANWPDGEKPDSTLQLLEEARTAFPNLCLLQKAVPPHTPIGMLRRELHSIISLRAHAAGIDDLVHITMDADTVWVHPELVPSFVRQLKITGADACVGQLDWDNLDIPTAMLPELWLGQELMRLLPKHGNKRLITDPNTPLPLLMEAIFSPRSFGRGVQSNFAFTERAYQRAGGYLPEPHDEFDSLLRRMWLSRWLQTGDRHALTFGWKEDGIAVISDARRALWALAAAGKPPMRQWDDIPFLARDRVRNTLPENLRSRNPGKAELEQQINLTLAVFNLPPEELEYAVKRTLAELGLNANLRVKAYPPDPVLGLAQVRLL